MYLWNYELGQAEIIINLVKVLNDNLTDLWVNMEYFEE